MNDGERAPVTGLVEHYFRYEYGRLVSRLARAYGVSRIEMVEDAVQGALLLALTSWGVHGAPKDPGAWLYRVANNRIIDVLRGAAVRKHADEGGADQFAAPPSPERFEREFDDDMLRMLFVCCDEAIPVESQLVLALKTLCGFGTGEIAARLFISEENVRKRLSRARDRLRELDFDTETPADDALRARLERVHTVIYLLFTEGYHSSLVDSVIRRELCDEAIRLATILVEHPRGDVPATRALLALMHFHVARLEARVDPAGALVLFDEQDRGAWDPEMLRRGCAWLASAAEGDELTRFHIEAGIAAEHALAPSYAETRWGEIAALYAQLEQVAPSPLHTLHRAIAVAHDRGSEAGLELLASMEPPSWLRAHHVWDAAHGELHRRAGRLDEARTHFAHALDKALTSADKAALRKRLTQCSH